MFHDPAGRSSERIFSLTIDLLGRETQCKRNKLVLSLIVKFNGKNSRSNFDRNTVKHVVEYDQKCQVTKIYVRCEVISVSGEITLNLTPGIIITEVSFL